CHPVLDLSPPRRSSDLGGGAVASGVRGHIYASVLFTLCLRGELSGSDECARPPWRLHPKRPVGRRAPSGPGSGPPSPHRAHSGPDRKCTLLNSSHGSLS